MTAREIKEFTDRTEPRILAKMDEEEDLPELFRRHGVFVLPVDRRTYAIVRGQGHHRPEPMDRVRPTIHEATLPISLMEMAEKGPLSEGHYLEHAYNTGLLERFFDVKPLYGLFAGRTTTPSFLFSVGTVQLQVKGAQMELDQAYVDGGQIFIAEAKIGVPRSFIIRQLYYPFRSFKLAEPGRVVRILLFAYEKGTKSYYLWEYGFTDTLSYESIELVKAARFTLLTKPLHPEQFAVASDLTDAIPQADDLRKVMELTVQVGLGSTDSRTVAAHFQFTTRQSFYYRQAAEMLGLVDLNKNRYSLTSEGKKFFSLVAPERNRMMTELLLRHPIMQEVFKQLLSHPDRPVSRRNVAEIISQRSKLTGTTLTRRAQTILSWFRWVQTNFGLVVVIENKVSLPTRFDSEKQSSV